MVNVQFAKFVRLWLGKFFPWLNESSTETPMAGIPSHHRQYSMVAGAKNLMTKKLVTFLRPPRGTSSQLLLHKTPRVIESERSPPKKGYSNDMIWFVVFFSQWCFGSFRVFLIRLEQKKICLATAKIVISVKFFFAVYL